MGVSAGVIGFHGTKLLLALSLALAIYGANGPSESYGGGHSKTLKGPHSDGTPSAASSEMTWTGRDLPEKGRLYFLEDVAYGNSTFVAVGWRGTILTSRDGVRWVERPSGIEDFLQDVAYGNGTFVAVGEWGTILTSRDGVKWMQQPSGTDEDLQEVAYGNGTFVVVGNDALFTSP